MIINKGSMIFIYQTTHMEVPTYLHPYQSPSLYYFLLTFISLSPFLNKFTPNHKLYFLITNYIFLWSIIYYFTKFSCQQYQLIQQSCFILSPLFFLGQQIYQLQNLQLLQGLSLFFPFKFMINTARSIESQGVSNYDDKRSSCSNKIVNQKLNRHLKKLYAKNQNIEECLSTLDIFKNIMEDAQEMKTRIIRDVARSIFVSSYEEGHIIYDVNDQSNEIFLVFQGAVSLNIRTEVQEKSPSLLHSEPQGEFTYKQVETFQKGEGFGEAEFIRGRTRDFQAQVKVKNSIIGRLHIQSFEQVIENYKMRVYYKKLEMFKKCPLLSEISPNRLQFIVNSSKPILLGISKTLIKEGQHPKCLYLVSKGQLQFVKNTSKSDEFRELSSWNSKKSSRYFISPKAAKEKLQIRKVNQGSFIGDSQIALQKPFDYDIHTVSEKVYLYACDIRLILSQISTDDLQKSKIFYNHKLNIQNHQLNEIKKTRKVANENSQPSSSDLTAQQIKIKKQLRKRYLNVAPFSLIDESSPQEIDRMLEKKRSRLLTQLPEPEKTFPEMQLFQRKKPIPIKRRNVFHQQEQKEKRTSLEYSSLSLSPIRYQNQRLKSYQQVLRLSTVQQDERASIQVKKNKKRKVSLPPLLSISFANKKNSINPKALIQTKNKIFSNLQLSDYRMNELIQKIQLMRQLTS